MFYHNLTFTPRPNPSANSLHTNTIQTLHHITLTPQHHSHPTDALMQQIAQCDLFSEDTQFPGVTMGKPANLLGKKLSGFGVGEA